MAQLRYISVAVALLASVFLLGEINAQDEPPVEIGNLYECAHDLAGKVFVKNDRELIIEDFHYDGMGPGAWFHGQLRVKNIQTVDSYVTLPFPGSNCDRLEVEHVYNGETITLILPRSIKDFETIGVLCYQYCHNFGHIVIPEDLEVPPAPEDLMKVDGCQSPYAGSCANGGPIIPDCPAGRK